MKYDLTSSTKAPHRIYGARGISALSASALSTALAVVIFTGVSVPAEAQVYWGSDDYDSGRRFESRPFDSRSFDNPPFERRRHHAARVKPRREAEPIVKEASKPQGPIVITISIDEQRLRLYDSNGLFAESPVSTGMRGHSTPMGVFSVIGKEKFHRSNIYSGAPMPYMQRITWSGVAMHAGVLPGYPASHGCIRMPMNFAVRMYGWTRQGARVVIAPNELSPLDFSHPLLFTRKPDPVKVAAAPSADAPKAAPSKSAVSNEVVSTPKSDKASADIAAATKTNEADKGELRPSHIPGSNEPIQTADASGAVPQRINDAMAQSADPKVDVAADAEPRKDKDQARQTGEDTPVTPASSSPDVARPNDAKNAAVKPDTAKADTAKPDAATTDKAAAVPPPPKPRTGHIAAYVSRKEGKLFVRQNFEPLFEVPVEIADRDRQLGTHVFTMRADKDNAQLYRWSVVSLPVRAAAAEPAARRRKNAEPVVQVSAAAPSSPSEALDRLKIPDEAMQKIAEAIAPGGSITVSDQGLGGETGLGTDFIVPLR